MNLNFVSYITTIAHKIFRSIRIASKIGQYLPIEAQLKIYYVHIHTYLYMDL